MREISIYIHIPFCVQICKYCDFAVCKYRNQDQVKTYLEALKKEMENRLSPLAPIRMPSIYLGGGTPSLISSRNLNDLFKHLSKWAVWDPTAEITLEANPDTFGAAQARYWKKIGINRLSLGIQSFNAPALKKLGRLHTPDDNVKSFAVLKGAGIQNINLDLIYGLPGESLKDFENTLSKTLSLYPSHVSLYQLAVEKHTPFFTAKEKGKLPLPDEEETAAMYESAVNSLEADGFRHYELQNFSRLGFESIHNRRYWNHEEFLGFGVGAYSYIDNRRFGHDKKTASYLKKIKQGDFSPDIEEMITEEIKLKEKIILGLRFKEGIDLELLDYQGLRVPQTMIEKLDKLTDENLLIKQGQNYKLTLKGQELSETVASRLV